MVQAAVVTVAVQNYLSRRSNSSFFDNAIQSTTSGLHLMAGGEAMNRIAFSVVLVGLGIATGLLVSVGLAGLPKDCVLYLARLECGTKI